MSDAHGHDDPSAAEEASREAALETVAGSGVEAADHERRDAGQHGEVEGDATEPLGGVLSGERDYVAVDPQGLSGEQRPVTAADETGSGEFDTATEGQQAEGQG